jgi:hypothetical protein
MTVQTENVLPSNSDTLLVISSFGNMLYQARGLTQTLTAIGAATQLERTINGTLLDLSAAQFRKYTSKIDIPSEVYAPPLDGIFPGREVTVECAASLSYVTGRPGSPNRSVVSGSMWSEGGYTFYRPELIMLIRSVEVHFDEWKNVVGWTVELEEK